MKILILTIVSILFVSIAFAKPPVSLHPENPVPKAPEKNAVDLSQYKNVKLKEKEASQLPSCTSPGGAQYRPGTVNYDTCMKETEKYAPTGFEDKAKSQPINPINPIKPSN
jgi:hypothetical protein